MTERTARRQDLQFTGVYNRTWDSDKSKARAAEIRKKYKCRAVLVNAEGGVSVYADAKYFAARTAEDMKNRLAQVEAKKKRAHKAYLAAIAEIEADAEKCLKNLTAAEAVIGA